MKNKDNVWISKRLLMLFLFLLVGMALVASVEKSKSKKPEKEVNLSETKWYSVEHDELYGSYISTSIVFLSDSTGEYSLLSIDNDSSMRTATPFRYDFNMKDGSGRIYMKGDEKIYPFKHTDTALLFPGIRWDMIPYKQK